MPEGPKPEPEVSASGVTIADSVVAKVAYTACRDIEGVHALGGATSRALSSLRGGESRTQGVSVDLREDGVDLDITLVITYGVNIPKVADACRVAVKEQVEGSTGLSVRSINIVVSDIYFPEGPADTTGGQA